MENERLRELVVRVQSGDQDAAGELFLTSRDDLYYYILKTVNNDTHLAEDILQDSFVEILETIDKLREPAAYVTWSRQIAYHRCTAYFRKRRDLLADENEDGQTVFDNMEEDRTEFIPDEALEKEDLKQTIGQMLDDLPEEQRSAMLLRYFDELSVADIAKIQGVSEGTVKSRLNYGRKALKSSVETYEKKNGIKLHSVAILPLLLWFFREKALSAGASLTTKTATSTLGTVAASAAAEGAKAVVSGGAKAVAAEGAKAVVKETAKTAAREGVKGASKAGVKQFIANVLISATIATTAAVGTTVAMPEETKDKIAGVFQETTSPTEEIPTTQDMRPTIQIPEPEALPATPTAWSGYDVVRTLEYAWTDLLLTSITETSVSGHITVSYGATVLMDADFTGEGTEENKVITYILTLPNRDEDSIYTPTLKYNRTSQTFELSEYMESSVSVTLQNTADIVEQPLATGTWSGPGICDDIFDEENSTFTVEITYFSSAKIEGHVTVLHDNLLHHDLYFTGRGRPDGDGITYDAVVTANGVASSETIDLEISYFGGTDTIDVKIEYDVYGTDLTKN